MAESNIAITSAVSDLKNVENLATQRGKRGIITIKIGNLIRTMSVPINQVLNPLEVMRRRARKPKI